MDELKAYSSKFDIFFNEDERDQEDPQTRFFRRPLALSRVLREKLEPLTLENSVTGDEIIVKKSTV